MRLENCNGIVAEFSPIGASLQRFLVPDSGDKLTNIILSPADPLKPRSKNAYAGAILGPIAGRVKSGKIAANGVFSQLDLNDGPNHLHGGSHCLSDIEWKCIQSDQQCVSFFTSQPNGLGGYPGNRTFEVKYILGNDNALNIFMHAASDEETWFNLSTHIYWNLSGNLTDTILDHLLQIPSSEVVFNCSDHTTDRLVSSAGSIFDLRVAKPISYIVKKVTHEQVRFGRGLNHLFILEQPCGAQEYAPHISLEHPLSGRQLLVSTSLPCQWVYTGGYLGPNLQLLDGKVGKPNLAIAFEPQLGHCNNAMGKMHIQLAPQKQFSAWIKFSFLQPGLFISN